MGAEPLRLIFFTHNVAYRGGAFFHGLGQARSLAARGHEVTLVAISEDRRGSFEETTDGAVRIIHSPDLLKGQGRTGWDPWDALRRMKWLRGQKYDIAHAVDARPAVALPALYARRATGAAVVADWTDWFGRGGTSAERTGLASKVIAPFETYFEEHFHPRADGNIAISRALYDRAVSIGIPEDRLLRLPPGCDPDQIPLVDKHEARAKFGLPDDGVLIGYLGNIYQADADLLSDAMQRIGHEHADARLLMIGSFRATMAPELADSGRLLSSGYVEPEDLAGYLAACDFFVLPLNNTLANRGRWPSKINDYMAAARPTVSTSVGDLATIFQQADIGRLAQPEPEDLARALATMIEERAAWERQGATARHLAETEYSWSHVGAALESFYQKTLHARERREDYADVR
ncbi:MAG: glycosyltransferase family 4 protein [Dehalococcoidia bacterium]